MTRIDHIRQLLTTGSYSIHDLRHHVRKPNGDQWSMGTIERSVKALDGVVKDGNLYTIVR